MSETTLTRRTLLDGLESEAITIIREVTAECQSPVLLFSGGKDSIVLLKLAEKAFRPARFPFPIMHVDTGHNFPEVIEYRDRRVAELGVHLVVASVQAAIDAGRVVEETGPRASRNKLQTVALLDAAPTQEEQIDLARALRVLKTGWTPALRETYFRWFLKAANYKGGASFGLPPRLASTLRQPA